MKEVSPSEALFGFFGYLSSREEPLTIGDKEDCAPFVELLGEFCELNNFAEPREGWEENITFPSEASKE